MRGKLFRSAATAAVFCALATGSTPVLAKPPATKHAALKRDASGHPSLEGMWASNYFLTVEASADAPALVVSESEAKRLWAVRAKEAKAFFEGALDPEIPGVLPTLDGLPVVLGERRTRLVTLPADGRLPYTPEARKELTGNGPPESFDNVEDRPNAERCLVGDGQPPFTTFTFSDQLQILQTRNAVVLHSEYGGDMRVIPLTDKHGPAIFHDRLGDSIAHWEGATLVIETIRLPDQDRDRFYPMLIVPGEAKVIERLTRVSAQELLYQFTVIDPKVYAAPWSGEFSWYVTKKPMYEHACHEGNYSLSGILSGARHDEAVAREKAAVAAR